MFAAPDFFSLEVLTLRGRVRHVVLLVMDLEFCRERSCPGSTRRLSSDTAVLELVPAHATTPPLEEARARGLVTVEGWQVVAILLQFVDLIEKES